MNFPEIQSRTEEEMLAPELRLALLAEQHRHARAWQRLSVVERYKRIISKWRRFHLEDVEYDDNYWAAIKTERRAVRRRGRGRPLRTSSWQGSRWGF
jgi:hypothetical protein